MHGTLRTAFAVVGGFLVGSAANMGLVHLGGILVPPPAGVDISTMEGLKSAMPLFEPRHFLFPFLAHAVGTFVGSAVAILLAPQRTPIAAYIVGGLFFLGACVAVALIPAPIWFSAVDLLFAYAPMVWLARRLLVREGKGR